MIRTSSRNITLYPWFRFVHGLVFWQSVWFLYIQANLSAAEAILLYAIYDITTTIVEVPSGYMSDRIGRRRTLIIAAVAGVLAASFQAYGGSFAIFVAGNICLGVSAAFLSGTDSSLLYESLAETGREAEVERAELVSWRFSFVALALSAVMGGWLWRFDPTLPYITTALAFVAGLIIALTFTEPKVERRVTNPDIPKFQSLCQAFSKPVLIWLLALSMLMYLFSHVPFVFGQPFILEALARNGLAGDAPLISGIITALMMMLSVLVSLLALQLRQRIGLAAILLLAFGIQIGLIGVLTLSNATAVIALLVFRMVPNSLSQPFILARIQPLLASDSRATYLSIQSLGGRLVFATTLWISANATTNVAQMPYTDIQTILGWYSTAGFLCLSALAIFARRSKVNYTE